MSPGTQKGVDELEKVYLVYPCMLVYPGAGYTALAPQRAAAVAGPVKIPPQFESFYTVPIKFHIKLMVGMVSGLKV